tara:strand:- start:18323 stop:19339 length:1017 start_codon:yes stop_codon:yes gene_type:complete
MTIYTKQGLLKYKEDLPELIKDKSKLPLSQHNRQTGGDLRKFHNCDFSKRDYSGMTFDGILFDDSDFAYTNFKGCTFYKCGLRNANFYRSVIEGVQFINCNMRESTMTQCFGDGSKFVSCNMVGLDMQGSRFKYTHLEGNDMRKANCRGTKFSNTFWKSNKMRGMNTRDTQFQHAGGDLPHFFWNEAYTYKLSDPESVHYAYKLAAANGRGIYHPMITYSEGTEFDAEVQDDSERKIPIDEKYNSGIALAPLNWVLREWVLLGAYSDYNLFLCSYKAKDVIENEGNTKFNVRKMKCIKKIDIAEFYELMDEDIKYHTGGTAALIDEFEINNKLNDDHK